MSDLGYLGKRLDRSVSAEIGNAPAKLVQCNPEHDKREGVLLAAYDLSGRNLTPAAARDFTGRLLDLLNALPNVDTAAIAAMT